MDKVRCEECGKVIGKIRDGMIVAELSKGKNKEPLSYYWTNGVMSARCCGKLKIYTVKGYYKTSAI